MIHAITASPPNQGFKLPWMMSALIDLLASIFCLMKVALGNFTGNGGRPEKIS